MFGAKVTSFLEFINIEYVIFIIIQFKTNDIKNFNIYIFCTCIK